MQEIVQCLSCNRSCFKDECKLRQHLASLWRKKPHAGKMLKMPAWQHQVLMLWGLQSSKDNSSWALPCYFGSCWQRTLHSTSWILHATVCTVLTWALLAVSATFCIFKHHRNTFFQVNTFSFCRMPVPEKVSDQSTVMQLCRSLFQNLCVKGSVLVYFVWFLNQLRERQLVSMQKEYGMIFFIPASNVTSVTWPWWTLRKELDMFFSQCKDVMRLWMSPRMRDEGRLGLIFSPSTKG